MHNKYRYNIIYYNIIPLLVNRFGSWVAYNPPDLSLRSPLFLTLVSLTIHNSNFDNRVNLHLLSTLIN
jgi:hypothetical protein